MLIEIHPKLPMQNKAITKEFYIHKLGFQQLGSTDYDGYLMIQKDSIQIHFFEFAELDPAETMDKFIFEQTTLTTYINHY